MEKKTIGAFIAALRKANGLTQKQLADRLSVSDKAVSRWERDETLPDLTLIPVIAEIFGVTSDELLRGQRINPDKPVPESAPESTEKQLRRFLSAAKIKFKIQSIISVAVAFPGFIAAMICNFAFNRAHLGFLLGCIFFGAALSCQVIFTVLASSRMDAEELDPKYSAAFNQYLIRVNEVTFSCIAVMVVTCLPLLICVPDPYWGLASNTFALISLLYIPACVGVCALACWGINIKLGYSTFSIKAKLRLLTTVILIPVMVCTWLLHYYGTTMLEDNYRHLMAEHTKYETFEEFKKAIETPLDPAGNPMIVAKIYPDADWILYKNADGEEFLATIYIVFDGNNPEVEKYRYTHANKTISDWYHDGTTFYTFTQEQEDITNRNYRIIAMALFILYPIEIAVAIMICHKKVKNLNKNT